MSLSISVRMALLSLFTIRFTFQSSKHLPSTSARRSYMLRQLRMSVALVPNTALHLICRTFYYPSNHREHTESPPLQNPFIRNSALYQLACYISTASCERTHSRLRMGSAPGCVWECTRPESFSLLSAILSCRDEAK